MREDSRRRKHRGTLAAMSTLARAESSVDWIATPLTEAHLAEFHRRGFVTVERAYPEPVRAALLAAIRRDLPPWEEVGGSPPADRRGTDQFPYEQPIFNRFIVDPELLGFVRRALATDHIHFRFAHNWVRYPLVGASHDPPRVHIDHGNNSLLPPNADARYGQVSCWYFPDAVGDEEAPMMVIPKEHGMDVSKGVRLTLTAGTLMVFNTQLWHSATPFRARSAQRYSITRIYGRADHYWEGVGFITSLGLNEQFRTFIGGLTAAERELFRFPPPGHEYYTDETLAVLEAQYPGWNQREEYAPGTDVASNDDPRLHSFPLPGV